MNKTELLTLLHQLGVRPNRRLGQNFLIDLNLRDAIIRDFAPQPHQEILEIGPGTGILTERLLALGCRVTAVEIDHRFCVWLQQRFANCTNFRLLQGDACKIDYDHLFPAGPYRCLANLPYAVSSPWLCLMSKLKNPPLDMGLLVQKELADRLTAPAGTRDYGSLTLAVGICYHLKITRKVPAAVFYPAPEVESACLQLVKNPWIDSLDRDRLLLFLNLVRIGFSHRRKQLLKLLTAAYPEFTIPLRQTLEARGRALNARAEELEPEDFLALAAAVDHNPGRF